MEISTFFADRQHFEWMLESSINLQKQAIAEDPCCLEALLTSCLLKSAAFASLVSLKSLWRVKHDELIYEDVFAVEWRHLGDCEEAVRGLAELFSYIDTGEWVGWDYVPASKTDKESWSITSSRISESDDGVYC